ncbi:thiol-disulfide oxidoreductase DCC family protein [Halobacillus salinus]|uniref:thiol-disulfide oxidoreductase DCC family protein n=1 Tax=Halobacillus salinus TaxID=192814 RepID=UPI0009A685FC|nr:DCC1-like thiol-disulfide oxidoreductase family protein [Halobacillus salinus]
MNRIILFDGECHFCDWSVQFVMKRDPYGYFHFAALQSDTGQRLLAKHDIPVGLDSFVLIEGDRYFMESTAALRVCKKLNGIWPIIYIFRLLPNSIRNPVYQFIARNRYKWFGKKNQCMLPTPDQRDRFL